MLSIDLARKRKLRSITYWKQSSQIISYCENNVDFFSSENIYFKLLVHFDNCLIIVGSECKSFAIESISTDCWHGFHSNNKNNQTKKAALRIQLFILTLTLQFSHQRCRSVSFVAIRISYTDKRTLFKHLCVAFNLLFKLKRVYLHNWKKITSSNDICIRSVAHTHGECERM